MAESYREMGGPELVDELREKYGISIEEHLDAGYVCFYFLVSEIACVRLSTDWDLPHWTATFETSEFHSEDWFKETTGRSITLRNKHLPGWGWRAVWSTSRWDLLTGSDPDVLDLAKVLQEHYHSGPDSELTHMEVVMDTCAQIAKLMQKPGVLKLAPPIVPPPAS